MFGTMIRKLLKIIVTNIQVNYNINKKKKQKQVFKTRWKEKNMLYSAPLIKYDMHSLN